MAAHWRRNADFHTSERFGGFLIIFEDPRKGSSTSLSLSAWSCILSFIFHELEVQSRLRKFEKLLPTIENWMNCSDDVQRKRRQRGKGRILTKRSGALEIHKRKLSPHSCIFIHHRLNAPFLAVKPCWLCYSKTSPCRQTEFLLVSEPSSRENGPLRVM